jgi:hypothetical protein
MRRLPALAIAAAVTSGACLITAQAVPAAAAVPVGAATGSHAAIGRALRIQPPPDAARDPQADLDAISCPSAGWCAAGGSYVGDSGKRLAMVAIERDGRWHRAVRLTMPANAVGEPFNGSQEVSAIWCDRGLRWCVAVGSYITATFSGGFMATWSATSWHPASELRLPADATGGGQLSGVSCHSAGICVAVGGYYAGAALRQEAMTATESAGRWSQAARLPVPAGAHADRGEDLFGIWCGHGRSCVAVGDYRTRALADLGLAATGSPGHWHIAPIPLPAGAATQSGLNEYVYTALSCRSLTHCLAAGSYLTRTGVFQAGTALFAGGRWTARQARLPAGAAPDPMAAASGVSCSAASCEVVGWFALRSGAVQPVAVRQSASWQPPRVTALPADALAGRRQVAGLDAVWCTVSGKCTASGEYVDSAGKHEAMVTERA